MAYIVLVRRLEDYKTNKDSEAQRMALVKGFEIIYELTWKVLKLILEEGSLTELNTPKSVFRQAYQSKIITNIEIWLDTIAIRNLTVDTYDQEVLNTILNFISKKFSPLLEPLQATIKEML